TYVAEGAQRDEDDAGPQLRERLGREPALAERARPVALREHVGLAHQSAQRLEILRLAQVEMGRELAVAGVVLLVTDVRQMLRSDLQDVGAVLGQGAGARRPGED